MHKYLLGLYFVSFSLFAYVDASYFDLSKLQKLEDYLFHNERADVKTGSLLIMHEDKIIYEKYKEPYHSQTKQLSWSMAKTITGLLIGIAIDEKILKLDDTIGSIVPGLPPIKSSITIDHIMHMSSGIKFFEIYAGQIWKSDVYSMLFKNGTKDMGAFVLQLPMSYKPGERFYYSSGDSTLLMYLLKYKMSNEQYNRYPFDKLFKPLGITEATFEQDEAGTFVGSSFAYLRSVDFAKIGSLFLNDGKYLGKQIVSKSWIDYMKTQTPGFNHPDNVDTIRSYGAQLWINKGFENGIEKAVYPSLPLDTIFLQGTKGQLTTVIPSERIIFVKTAFDGDKAPQKDYYFSLLFDALKNKHFQPLTYAEEPPVKPADKKQIDSAVIENAVENAQVGINNSIFSIFSLSTKLITRLTCSCHFVQGLDLDYCIKFYSKFPVVLKSSIEENPKALVLYTLLGKGRAIFRGPDLGCYATEP